MVGSEHDAVAQLENEHASNGQVTNGHAKACDAADGHRTIVSIRKDHATNGHAVKVHTTNGQTSGDVETADIYAAVATKCIHELFEAQVDRHPANTALIFRGERWSYQEVEERANQLAHQLRARGVGPGKFVGVYFNRSEKPVIAILATLKAGGAYVPIDAGYPPERVRHIVEEAEVTVLLTEQALWEIAYDVCPDRSIAVDTDARTIGALSRERLTRQETGLSPCALAYILFTSGTTGRPKGVMIEHQNVVGFATSLNKVLKMGPTDRVYQGFSLGFDASVEELWMAFTNGGALVVAPADVVRVPEEVVKYINEHQVTFISMVPTFLSILGTDMPTVRIVISGGEACPPEVIRRWQYPGRRVINTYGPTETTVDATWVECKVDEPVTIGIPLPAYSAHVLDENLRPVGPGQSGELCIGGVGVARGYLKRPDLTEQKFVANPFANGNGLAPRLYRSGDLVRITADGEIDFLGRIDRQVKIRGFRIELSEIESVLHDHESIQQALVEVFEREDGMKELAAFVVPQDEHSNGLFDRDAVLAALRERLPAYMVPSYLELIGEIPTLPSGKADRSRLPKPSSPLVSSSKIVVGPADVVEQKIAGVWEMQLKLTSISCADDFFTDLGGHSLLAAEMVSLLRSEHGFDVAIRDVYEQPTVQKLAAHISATMSNASLETISAGEQPKRRTSREAIESVPRWTRWTVYSMQAVSLVIGYGLATLPLTIFIMLVVGMVQGRVPLGLLIMYTVAITLLSLPLAIGFAISMKWLVIRRYKPGRYPLWGFYYFRWWLATRVQSVSGMTFFEGTPLISLFYRLMGAKVGKNCVIDTSF
ncbi:MAG: amino acid adenylation domain-containing protein, partial [Pirellulales bacterium]